MQWFQNSVWCTCLWRHDAHAHAIWCSWCMLAWLGYPQNELVIARAINELKRSVCVVSRILTTKIPSAPLGAITWLQHTWCPRFRRGTIGYGITPHQNIREIEYEHWNFSWVCTLVHPMLPHACAMRCVLKSDICFNLEGCEQDQKDQVQDWRSNWSWLA
jgi:hypothetical protein